MGSSEELIHPQPVTEVPTKNGRRAFLLVGSLGGLFGVVAIYVADLVNPAAAAPIPCIGGVGLALALSGNLFCAHIAMYVAHACLWQTGNTGLAINAAARTAL